MPKKEHVNYIRLKRLSKRKQIKYYKLKHLIFYYYDNHCFKCNSKQNLELDHIKPFSKYPELFFEPSNLQILCKHCNILKSNKTNDDYRKPKDIENFNCEYFVKQLKIIHKNKYHYTEIPMPSYLKYKGTLKDKYRLGLKNEYKRKLTS